jgi:hypothetical protein
MARFLNLALTKQHLLVDTTVTEDDAYIGQLMDVAESVVERDIDIPLDALTDGAGNLPAPILQAMLLVVGNLYANREPVATGTIAVNVPYTFEYLKGLYKNHPVG